MTTIHETVFGPLPEPQDFGDAKGRIFGREQLLGRTSAPIPATSAAGFLHRAGETMRDRGQTYDRPGGERSGGAAAAAFNAITGRTGPAALTGADVYLLLQVLKDVRQWRHPERHYDSALDAVAYAALKAEEVMRGGS